MASSSSARPAAEHRAPGRGIVGGRALGEAERSVRVQRLAGDRLPRRIALVEQRCDLRLDRRCRSVFGLAPLAAAWRPRTCGFGGASSVLLQGFRDRIDLRRLRLLLVGFGSSFGFCSATGFGGSGFFSTGFSSTFGCGGGAVSVDDRRLLARSCRRRRRPAWPRRPSRPAALDFPSCRSSCRR